MGITYLPTLPAGDSDLQGPLATKSLNSKEQLMAELSTASEQRRENFPLGWRRQRNKCFINLVSPDMARDKVMRSHSSHLEAQFPGGTSLC